MNRRSPRFCSAKGAASRSPSAALSRVWGALFFILTVWAADPSGAADPGVAAATPSAARPAAPAANPAPDGLSYADLADLAVHAPTVVRVKVRSTARVEPERATGLQPGHARLYTEARVITLLAGPPLAGENVRYLVDVPLDARGHPPKRGKGDVVVFARTRPDHLGELQLVAPDAQIAWSAPLEARLKTMLQDLLAADAPPRVTGVREAIYVPGNLAGEGETQIFLSTANAQPASITVVHRPGESPTWSASFSEVLDSSGTPPQPETLPWYRLACFLPGQLAPEANVSATPADKAQAEADYRLVRTGLGDCARPRSRPAG